ncbi:MAG: hypothetical protein ACOC16_00885 [Nanoarchaeota archaeon]
MVIIIKKSSLILIVLILLLFNVTIGCTTQKQHNDLSIGSSKIVSFNYKLYETPPFDEYYYFPFTINLEDINFVGSKAFIQFESGHNYKIEEEKINFVFVQETLNIKVRMIATDIYDPIYLKFKGGIEENNGKIRIFSGELKINREQPSANKLN